MEELILSVTQIVGFVFMLTLIMSFVRMASGRKVEGGIKGVIRTVFVASSICLLAISVFVSII